MSKGSLLFIATILVAISGAGFYFFTSYQKDFSLISPLFIGHDYTDKIELRVDNSFKLDLSTSKELSTLENVPRYIVYNQDTGQVYYSKGSNLRLSPASFTKLLSAQVALDFLPVTEKIEVHEESINKVPTILGLKKGEIFLLKDILRGSIATSANDAAQVIADEVSRKYEMVNQEFIYYMNKKSTLLGMNHSHFKNPDGLDDQYQYSTLEDISKLVNNVQKNYPDILEAAKSDNIDIATSSAHGYYYLPNWNGLLGVYPGVDGLKIAYTEEAGYSTIVTAQRDNKRMVSIVSGTGSYIERDRAAADLLDAAFLYEGLQPISVSKNKLNLRYKTWGDLARKIREEIRLLELNKK